MSGSAPSASGVEPSAAEDSRGALTRFAIVAQFLVTLAFPVVAYFTLSQGGPRSAAWALAPLFTLLAALRGLAAPRGMRARAAAFPLVAACLLGIGGLAGDARFALAMPVVVSVGLLVVFASTLPGTPIIERFARRTEPELSPEKVRYCRRVTWVWCVFFVLNASIAAWLAWRGEPRSWALYTGLLAYLAVAALGVSEYLVRKWRFRDYSSVIYDRWIARVWPPQVVDASASAMGKDAR